MSHSICSQCGQWQHEPRCRHTLPLPLEPVSYGTEPFVNRSARAQRFRRATANKADDAKWIAELSKFSAHAVVMCESAPAIYALINSRMGARQVADQLERARDVRTWLRRNDFPAAFVRLSYRAAAYLGPFVGKISKVSPTIFAQSIPADRQSDWARFVYDFLMQERRGRTDVPLEYILTRSLELSDVFGDARHFVDFLRDSGVEFDQRWGANRLRRELLEWERTFAIRKLEAERKRIEIIEGCPERLTLKGFDFIALNSREALMAEGAAMRHCVGGSSYAWSVEQKRSVIYAVQNASERGTLQIEPGQKGMEIRQLKGPRNAMVSAQMTAAAKAFCEAVSGVAAERMAA